jgi:hypothetical protein
LFSPDLVLPSSSRTAVYLSLARSLLPRIPSSASRPSPGPPAHLRIHFTFFPFYLQFQLSSVFFRFPSLYGSSCGSDRISAFLSLCFFWWIRWMELPMNFPLIKSFFFKSILVYISCYITLLYFTVCFSVQCTCCVVFIVVFPISLPPIQSPVRVSVEFG